MKRVKLAPPAVMRVHKCSEGGGGQLVARAFCKCSPTRVENPVNPYLKLEYAFHSVCFPNRSNKPLAGSWRLVLAAGRFELCLRKSEFSEC